MAKTTAAEHDPAIGDHCPKCCPAGNAIPPNSTFSSRRAAREARGQPAPPKRRMSLRAGTDAETDFTITTDKRRIDRVQQIRA